MPKLPDVNARNREPQEEKVARYIRGKARGNDSQSFGVVAREFLESDPALMQRFIEWYEAQPEEITRPGYPRTS